MIEIIEALIKQISDIELVFELQKKLTELKHEKEIDELEKSEGCISPEWDSIGKKDYTPREVSLELTKSFITYCKEKKHSKPLVKKKKPSKSILEVLERKNIRMKSRMILCPFHPDTRPSCRIYPETNTFYCFGCQKFGTAEDLEEVL